MSKRATVRKIRLTPPLAASLQAAQTQTGCRAELLAELCVRGCLQHTGKKAVSVELEMPRGLYTAALARAKEEGVSLDRFVAGLAEADLKTRLAGSTQP